MFLRERVLKANEHGFSWAVCTLEKASPLGVCVDGQCVQFYTEISIDTRMKQNYLLKFEILPV